MQGILNEKYARTESSNTVRTLQEKQSENNEISPFIDIQHHKFIVHPGRIITYNN